MRSQEGVLLSLYSIILSDKKQVFHLSALTSELTTRHKYFRHRIVMVIHYHTL